jgi:soluble epoxide hydrolase / lipid-phosphate phosphatase
MDKLDKKTLDVSRGFTYTYYASPAQDNKQTLLLVHGFPDGPETYDELILDYLLPNGYGAIAIDCLGYSGTSKPTDKESYSLELQAHDLKEIVDKEGLDKVVIVGHDWVRRHTPFLARPSDRMAKDDLCPAHQEAPSTLLKLT